MKFTCKLVVFYSLYFAMTVTVCTVHDCMVTLVFVIVRIIFTDEDKTAGKRDIQLSISIKQSGPKSGGLLYMPYTGFSRKLHRKRSINAKLQTMIGSGSTSCWHAGRTEATDWLSVSFSHCSGQQRRTMASFSRSTTFIYLFKAFVRIPDKNCGY